ncbi:hypothetical protein A3715_20995 [Oleiphilus sp. HI0009]|nr:hypothetical protein A3715_14060 [Oleiphilus sp. HI0009]KZX77567.1 hypothetical protein A3715_20995 [Oleiphilus sp. HI0009]
MLQVKDINDTLNLIIPGTKFSSSDGSEANFVAWCEHKDADNIILRIKNAFKSVYIGGLVNLEKRQLLISVKR